MHCSGLPLNVMHSVVNLTDTRLPAQCSSTPCVLHDTYRRHQADESTLAIFVAKR